MACTIQERSGYFEVRVPAGATKFDMLAAVGVLSRRDPDRRTRDLWLFDKDVFLAYGDFASTVEMIQRLYPPGMRVNRAALVAAGAFQQAQMELFSAEAARLPFEIRVFDNEPAALAWLQDGVGKPDP